MTLRPKLKLFYVETYRGFRHLDCLSLFEISISQSPVYFYIIYFLAFHLKGFSIIHLYEFFWGKVTVLFSPGFLLFDPIFILFRTGARSLIFWHRCLIMLDSRERNYYDVNMEKKHSSFFKCSYFGRGWFEVFFCSYKKQPSHVYILIMNHRKSLEKHLWKSKTRILFICMNLSFNNCFLCKCQIINQINYY